MRPWPFARTTLALAPRTLRQRLAQPRPAMRGAGVPRAPSQKRGDRRTFALQRFRSAMDASADALFLIDAAALAIIDVSDGACRMLGYSRAALLGADPVRLGLAPRANCNGARGARSTPAPGPSWPMPMRCAELRAVVAVEISLQLQLQGGVRTLVALAREVRARQPMPPRLVSDADPRALALARALWGALERD